MSRKRNTAPGIHKYWENVKGIEYGYESIIIYRRCKSKNYLLRRRIIVSKIFDNLRQCLLSQREYWTLEIIEDFGRK